MNDETYLWLCVIPLPVVPSFLLLTPLLPPSLPKQKQENTRCRVLNAISISQLVVNGAIMASHSCYTPCNIDSLLCNSVSLKLEENRWSRFQYHANLSLSLSTTSGFHSAWLSFRRAFFPPPPPPSFLPSYPTCSCTMQSAREFSPRRKRKEARERERRAWHCARKKLLLRSPSAQLSSRSS